MPNLNWKLVTDDSPDSIDLPATVVFSKDRDCKVWVPLIQEITDEVKASVAPFFEHGENLGAEDWFPPVS